MSDANTSPNWGSALTSLGQGLENVGKPTPASSSGIEGYGKFLQNVINPMVAMNTAQNGNVPNTGLSSGPVGGDR